MIALAHLLPPDGILTILCERVHASSVLVPYSARADVRPRRRRRGLSASSCRGAAARACSRRTPDGKTARIDIDYHGVRAHFTTDNVEHAAELDRRSRSRTGRSASCTANGGSRRCARTRARSSSTSPTSSRPDCSTRVDRPGLQPHRRHVHRRVRPARRGRLRAARMTCGRHVVGLRRARRRGDRRRSTCAAGATRRRRRRRVRPRRPPRPRPRAGSPTRSTASARDADDPARRRRPGRDPAAAAWPTPRPRGGGGRGRKRPRAARRETPGLAAKPAAERLCAAGQFTATIRRVHDDRMIGARPRCAAWHSAARSSRHRRRLPPRAASRRGAGARRSARSPRRRATGQDAAAKVWSRRAGRGRLRAGADRRQLQVRRRHAGRAASTAAASCATCSRRSPASRCRARRRR